MQLKPVLRYLNELKHDPSSPAAVVAVALSAPGSHAADAQYCRVIPVIVSVQWCVWTESLSNSLPCQM